MLMMAAIATVMGLTAVLLIPRIRGQDFRYRDVLLFAVVFTMPLRNATLFTLAGGHIRLGDLFLLLAIAAGVLEFVIARRRIRPGAIEVLLVLFVAWCICTLAWSLDRQFGLTRSLKFSRDLLLLAVVAYWSRGRFAAAFRAVSGGAIGSFLYILPIVVLRAAGRVSQLATGLAPSDDMERFRGAGGVGAATFAEGASILDVAVWTGLTIFFLLGRGGWMAPRRATRLLFWGFLFALVAIEVATFSRGAWVALAVGGAFWLHQAGPGVRRPLIAGATVLLVAVLLLAYKFELHQVVLQRAASLTAAESDKAVGDRLTYWQLSVDALAAHPMGVGIGGTTVAVERRGGMWFVHNVYLQLLVELGPIGFALAFGSLSLGIAHAVQRTRAADDWQHRIAPASIGASIVFYMVMGLAYFDFAELEIWLLLALATAAAVRETA